MQSLSLLAMALLACSPVLQDTSHPACTEGRHWDGSGCVLDDSDADTDADSDSDADSDTDADAPTWYLGDVVESLVYVGWDQPEDATARVEWSFEEDAWEQGPDRAIVAGPQEDLVLGIPYETEARVRVVYDVTRPDVTSREVTVETGNLPAHLPVPELLASIPELQLSSGRWLLGSINYDEGGWTSGEYWMFIVDREGRIVWARQGEQPHYTDYLHVSKDGDILWDVSTYWSAWDNGAASVIHRMKIDGVVTETWPAPGMHHCFDEWPDGSLVWGAAHAGSEQVLRRDLETGKVEVLWDCAPFYAKEGLTDWCHSNSIFLDQETDRLLLSFPTARTFVLEVDLETHEEVRWFGHIPGAWGFDPPDSAFWYQHGVTWTPDRTLLVSSKVADGDDEGVVREYRLDEETSTLVQVWTFGEGEGIDAYRAGEAHRLENGNTLHNTGTTPRIREITPDGDVDWDLAFPGFRLLGRTIFVEDLYSLAPEAFRR